MSNVQCSFYVVVVGVIGVVGEIMLLILVECDFLVGILSVFVFECLVGGEIEFNGQKVKVQDLVIFDLIGVEIVLFLVGGSVFKEYVLKFVVVGVVVIDNFLVFCYDDDVLLVVFEVNLEQVVNCLCGIIVNLNCLIMQMLVVLVLLYCKYGIECINVFIYQLVFGGGCLVMEELGKQIGQLFSFQEIDLQCFLVQIVFNLILYIDDFQDNGFIKEEMKLIWEICKILGDDSILVNLIVVCVLVFYGYFELVVIEICDKVIVVEVCMLLEQLLGIEVVDCYEVGGYLILVIYVLGIDVVYVGCICEDLLYLCGLNLWIVLDNVCKGVVLNVVQLVELVVVEQC